MTLLRIIYLDFFLYFLTNVFFIDFNDSPSNIFFEIGYTKTDPIPIISIMKLKYL